MLEISIHSIQFLYLHLLNSNKSTDCKTILLVLNFVRILLIVDFGDISTTFSYSDFFKKWILHIQSSGSFAEIPFDSVSSNPETVSLFVRFLKLINLTTIIDFESLLEITQRLFSCSDPINLSEHFIIPTNAKENIISNYPRSGIPSSLPPEPVSHLFFDKDGIDLSKDFFEVLSKSVLVRPFFEFSGDFKSHLFPTILLCRLLFAKTLLNRFVCFGSSSFSLFCCTLGVSYSKANAFSIRVVFPDSRTHFQDLCSGMKLGFYPFWTSSRFYANLRKYLYDYRVYKVKRTLVNQKISGLGYPFWVRKSDLVVHATGQELILLDSEFYSNRNFFAPLVRELPQTPMFNDETSIVHVEPEQVEPEKEKAGPQEKIVVEVEVTTLANVHVEVNSNSGGSGISIKTNSITALSTEINVT